jgi:NAD-dependent deacetylase
VKKPKLVILSGAGISAESGIPTFRDSNGLWEGHDVTQVASPEGWARNPMLVLDFYNKRRQNIKEVQPNRAHEICAELEADFEVTIVTQNIDNLHERAGSTHILHLHGEIFKSRSSRIPTLVYPCEGDINWGDKCDAGFQLRPHIVWFGEAVPLIEDAAEICSQADFMVVVGTSLQVYPAAGLLDFLPKNRLLIAVDPKLEPIKRQNTQMIREKAVSGMEKAAKLLIAEKQKEASNG